MLLLATAIAIAPGIAICLFIYSMNRYGRQSIGQLAICFLLGMIATALPFLIQSLVSDVRDEPYRHSVLSFAWYAFIVVAFTEEGSKWLALRLYIYPKEIFRQPFDGIIYGVMIGMGFATVENIEYVHKFGLETGVSRAFLSVPAHASFAVLMGYYAGWAKFTRQSRWLLLKGLLIATILHGSFDFFLFLKQNNAVKKYLSDGILSFLAFTSFYIAVRQAWKAIRLHAYQEEEEEDNGTA